MKRVLRSLRFSALIVACGLPLGGCQNDNEAGIATSTEGTSDPKYAKDDPATYQQYAKDQMKNAFKGKEKAGKSGTPPPPSK
jgi:hypothetical protein